MNFSSSEYLKSNMPVDTDDSIHAIHRNLQNYHECTVNELGKNFYRNYGEYVKVAQEADKFEHDLSAMRAMISQLKTFSSDITGIRDSFTEQNITIPNDATSPSIVNTPEPVVSMEQVEVDPELQAKLKRINDLLPETAKFTQETKSVLMESSTMAVYLEKQWKPAQVWLLSNGCIIASRKAKVSLTQGVRQKLTFERFYPADGIYLSDVKDTADLQNCFKIKGQQGSIFLHNEDVASKNSWYQQILKVIQEAQEKQQKINENISKVMKSETRAHRRTSSVTTSGTTARPSFDSCFEHKELTPDSANTFEKTLEDLNEALCCTNYDLALDLVEKLKFDFDKINFNSPLVNSLKNQFTELKNQLASYLFIEISDSLINRSRMVSHIQKLIVLGFTEEARERFLISRSDLMKSKTLKIQYYGDVYASVSLLSSITFESIENDFEWFNESFKDSKLMAAYVSWARNEIYRFCEVFSRQALRRDLSMEIIAECISDALGKCRNLGQCGLDLSLFLEDCLGETLKGALKSRSDIYLVQVDEALQKDKFEITISFDRPDWPKELFPPSEIYKATEALIQLAQAIESFLKDVLPLMKTTQLSNLCVSVFSEFVDSFSEKFLQTYYVPERSNIQSVNIAANMESIAKVLLPALIERFPSSHSSLNSLQKRLENTSEALYKIFSESLGKSLAPCDFSSYALIDSNNKNSISVSVWLENAIPIISQVSRFAPQSHCAKLIDNCIITIFSIFKAALDEKLIKFSTSAGLHKFTLDLKLISRLTSSMAATETTSLYDEIIDLATRGTGDLDRPLPSNIQMDAEISKLILSFDNFSLKFIK